jgi:YidC/Oxa1 family membrane protein insertase
MDQKRLALTIIISVAILFAWQYFFPAQTPRQNNINSATPSPSAETAPQSATQPVVQPAPLSRDQDEAPQRVISISTPLYELKIDSKGAVATSWIIKKNKETGRPIFSAAGNGRNPQPLELVSPVGLEREPREAPLRLIAGDPGLDPLLSQSNYRVSGLETDSGNASVQLASGESKRIDFKMRDEATGLDVVKSLNFRADDYSVDLEVKVTRGGLPVPGVKLAIGPSIGDQGVPHYTFYSVAPEGVYAAAGGHAERKHGSEVFGKEGNDHRFVVPKSIDWAGIGDTYFAMVLALPKSVEGLEYTAAKYEQPGTKEERYLITGLVPLPSDGSLTRLYVGPKDHDLLTKASVEISQALGRSQDIDLEGLIDYGFLGTISRPLAVPILWSIKKLHALTGSYGVAIIVFTIFIYSLFFPLKWHSSKAMKKAQKLAPRMKELQEKIKGLKQNDPRLKELQMEQLRLMKEGNPLGGCLPLLIQMPFLFALFRAITISIDFRQAHFLWLPDLSAADPYHLLPLLMAGSMMVLQLITPAPSADPLQRKMMAIGLPLFMIYMLWSAPAGLLVYWLVGNVVGFSQQLLINRLTKSEDDQEPPEKNTEVRSSKKLPVARASQA